ncbi:MAG: hypothetical protein PHT07_21490 [Paludibacter sp.]|nr:hypothetical protein [Paludibacter sp.]
MDTVIALIVPNGVSQKLHRYGPGHMYLPNIGDTIDLSYPSTDFKREWRTDDRIVGTVERIIHFPNHNPPEICIYIKNMSKNFEAGL